MGRGFIGGIISTVLGFAVLYFVWVFVYGSFPQVQPIMDDVTTAVSDFYGWAVSEWGSATVGGIILVLILAMVFNRRF